MVHIVLQICFRNRFIRCGQSRRNIPHQPPPLCSFHWAAFELLEELLLGQFGQVGQGGIHRDFARLKRWLQCRCQRGMRVAGRPIERAAFLADVSQEVDTGLVCGTASSASGALRKQ